MTLPFELSELQFARIEPHFPRVRGIPRTEDMRIISGVLYVIMNGLQWKDAPKEYGPCSTLYHRFVRWSRRGVFNRILKELAGKPETPERLVVVADQLKAHGTALRLAKEGFFPDVLHHSCLSGRKRATAPFELSRSQFARIEPFFPKVRGTSQAEDRRIISGIFYVIRNCLQWSDAPSVYGPHNTLRHRFVWWSRRGIFNQIFTTLAGVTDASERLVVTAVQLRAHRTGMLLVNEGLFPDVSDFRTQCPCTECTGVNKGWRAHLVGISHLRNDNLLSLR